MKSPVERRHVHSVLTLKGFKGRVAFAVVGAGFVCIAINACLFYAYVVNSYGVILQNSTLPPEIIDERYAELYGFWIALTAVSTVVLISTALWILIVAQRAAGPIAHFHKVIDSIRAGNHSERVTLRARDEYQDLAASFNSMLDQFENKTQLTGALSARVPPHQ